MTGQEVARMLRARRSGRDPKGRQTWRAKCPSHRSSGGTLSITSMDDGVRLHCFAGCTQLDVLNSIGLTWKDVQTNTKTSRRSLNGQHRLEDLKQRHGWMIVGKTMEPSRRWYYQTAILALEKDIRKLEDSLYPEKAFRRAIQEQLALRNFDKLWEMVLPRLENVRESSR